MTSGSKVGPPEGGVSTSSTGLGWKVGSEVVEDSSRSWKTEDVDAVVDLGASVLGSPALAVAAVFSSLAGSDGFAVVAVAVVAVAVVFTAGDALAAGDGVAPKLPKPP